MFWLEDWTEDLVAKVFTLSGKMYRRIIKSLRSRVVSIKRFKTREMKVIEKQIMRKTIILAVAVVAMVSCRDRSINENSYDSKVQKKTEQMMKVSEQTGVNAFNYKLPSKRKI